MFLEGPQRLFGLAFQAHQREDGDREAQLGGVEIGVIALDNPGFFKAADAAQARRRGQPDALGKLDVGDASFVLQFREQPTVDLIEIKHLDLPVSRTPAATPDCNFHIENAATL